MRGLVQRKVVRNYLGRLLLRGDVGRRFKVVFHFSASLYNE